MNLDEKLLAQEELLAQANRILSSPAIDLIHEEAQARRDAEYREHLRSRPTASQIQEAAGVLFDPNRLGTSIGGPEDRESDQVFQHRMAEEQAQRKSLMKEAERLAAGLLVE